MHGIDLLSSSIHHHRSNIMISDLILDHECSTLLTEGEKEEKPLMSVMCGDRKQVFIRSCNMNIITSENTLLLLA